MKAALLLWAFFFVCFFCEAQRDRVSARNLWHIRFRLPCESCRAMKRRARVANFDILSCRAFVCPPLFGGHDWARVIDATGTDSPRGFRGPDHRTAIDHASKPSTTSAASAAGELTRSLYRARVRAPNTLVAPSVPVVFKVWAELERCKGVIVEEPVEAAQFEAAKRQYETAIDGPGGNGSAVLLAVYRGKMSEVGVESSSSGT